MPEIRDNRPLQFSRSACAHQDLFSSRNSISINPTVHRWIHKPTDWSIERTVFRLEDAALGPRLLLQALV